MDGKSVVDGRKCDVADDDRAHRNWPWRRRLTSAAARRMKAWLVRHDGGATTVEKAVAWLNRLKHCPGLTDGSGRVACPRLTAGLLPTLLEFGQLHLLGRLLPWLLSQQGPDGSFPRTRGGDVSIVNTATALAAFSELAIAGMGDLAAPATLAAGFLHGVLHELVERENGVGRRARALTAMCGAAALFDAARTFSRGDWQRAAELVTARLRCGVDWRLWDDGSHFSLLAADAWLSTGEVELARDIVRWWSASQRRDGSLRGVATWRDNEVLAQLAVLWYQLGEHDRADHAVAFLNRQQRPDGGWSPRSGVAQLIDDSPWTAKYYLDAVRLQVAASFDQASTLPTTIAANDGRLSAVRDWLASVGTAPKVADVGCGPGRFLRELISPFPAASFVGIDPAQSMLAQLPSGIERREGNLLRIPAADGEFDGVLAVESLEHSLLPERAVEELCRVVRPGGKILIIDKHKDRQPLSLHQPWEQWFLPETIEQWLRRHCSQVRTKPIAHGSARDTNLFLCWEATRRSAAYEDSGSVPRLARNSLISPAA